jgi:hypothetical protein
MAGEFVITKLPARRALDNSHSTTDTAFGGTIMLAAVLMSWAMLAVEDSSRADALEGSSSLDAYRAQARSVGRDADAHVKLALWCEAHGLNAERLKHLALATLIDPNQATARGLLGLVASEGKWRKPVEVTARLAEDPSARALTDEYLKRRAETPDKPEAQWKLARWCEEHGLSAQASAHDRAVVRLDPRREAAWKKLGYKKHGDGWARPEEISARRREAEEQRLANAHWQPIVQKLREGLLSKDPGRRTRTEQALTAINDTRAVPAVWEVLTAGGPRLQLKAVEVLGQIDGPAASRALAAIAVLSPFPEIRGRAIDTAERRDPRDFLDPLLALIRRPFKYKVQPLNGPGSEGGLFVEGEKFNIQRLYQVAPIDTSRLPARTFSPDVPFDPFSVPNMAMLAGGASLSNPAQGAALTRRPLGAVTPLAADMASLVVGTQMAAIQRDQVIARRLFNLQEPARQAQQSLAQDIETVESWNRGFNELDDRVLPFAKAVTGQDFGTDRDRWLTWWNDQLGYVYQSPSTEQKPTYTQIVQFSSPPVSHSACFAAGTMVHTIDGTRAIENLEIGDQILSQDPVTGALSFQPILVIHHSSPSPTLSLRLGDETISATGIHRFWKAGKGWTMARDLKPGDLVRSIGGTLRLGSVEPDRVQPVFNLDVAENRDFFVGKRGCLVHDFSIVQPVPAPFDRPRE